MKFLIKHFKESGLAPETMLRTQRSRPFPKPEKWLIFSNLAKGGPHENLLERFNLKKRLEVTYFMKNEALMTMLQWISGCDYYFLSLDHFCFPNLPSKMGMKKGFLTQQLDCHCWPKANMTSLKVTWNEGPDQALQGKRLSSRDYAAYAR